MIVLTAEKQPWERKDYDIDYSLWLPATDTVASATAAYVCQSTPGNVALTLDTPVTVENTLAKVWAEGGTDGETYIITVRATTTGGRKVEAEIKLKVKDAP